MIDTKVKVNGKTVGEYDLINEPCVKKINGEGPDDNGNVEVESGGPTINGGYDNVVVNSSYNLQTTAGTNPYFNDGSAATNIQDYFEEFAGEECSVIFDGVEYRSVITKAYDSNVYADVYHFGNSEFTNIPFHIYVYWSVERHGDLLYIEVQDSSVSHTVDVTTYIKQPVKFDRKYLPDLTSRTDADMYAYNSYLYYGENRKVKWISCENSDSPLAPKTYVDKRITEKEVILKSSTSGSSKKFKITVDDSGTISATEITE